MKKLLCKIFNHIEGNKASCPFTLKTYTYCDRCNNIIYIEDQK